MCALTAAPMQDRRSWWPLLRIQWPSPADVSTLALHVHLYHCADTKPASLRVPAIFVLPWQLSASRGCGSRLTLRLQHPILSTLQFRKILLPVGSPDRSGGVATTGWTSEELGSIPGKGKATVLGGKKNSTPAPGPIQTIQWEEALYLHFPKHLHALLLLLNASGWTYRNAVRTITKYSQGR
jgi:hypothetical protein